MNSLTWAWRILWFGTGGILSAVKRAADLHGLIRNNIEACENLRTIEPLLFSCILDRVNSGLFFWRPLGHKNEWKTMRPHFDLSLNKYVKNWREIKVWILKGKIPRPYCNGRSMCVGTIKCHVMLTIYKLLFVGSKRTIQFWDTNNNLLHFSFTDQ